MSLYCHNLMAGVTPAVVPCDEICLRCLKRRSAYHDRPCYECWLLSLARANETGEAGGTSSPEDYESGDDRGYPDGRRATDPTDNSHKPIAARTDARWRRFKHE